jgi:Siphovirus Gp157
MNHDNLSSSTSSVINKKSDAPSPESCISDEHPSKSSLFSEHHRLSEVSESGPDTLDSSSLIEITNYLHQLEIRLLESGGELTPIIEEAFSEASVARERKVDAYAAVLARLESFANERRVEAEANMRLARGAEKTAEYLKSNLKRAMLTLDICKLEGVKNRFSISRIVSKLVIDEHMIPKDYMRVTTVQTVDKEAIRSALELGKEVPGASLEPNWRLNKTFSSKKGF